MFPNIIFTQVSTKQVQNHAKYIYTYISYFGPYFMDIKYVQDVLFILCIEYTLKIGQDFVDMVYLLTQFWSWTSHSSALLHKGFRYSS